jgi:hypothetical protein
VTDEPKSIWSIVNASLPIIAPLAMLLAGIWAGAVWSANQENKVSRIEERLAQIEARHAAEATIVGRVNQMEFRLNWMDEEKNRDRNERKQIDRDIRESLEKLNNAVTRLDAWNPSNRRRSGLHLDFDELLRSISPSTTSASARPHIHPEGTTPATTPGQGKDQGDQEDHRPPEAQAKQARGHD